MLSPEKKDLGIINIENVVCVYCGQIMGTQGTTQRVDPTNGQVSVSLIMENNLNLPRHCQFSPDREHANMTPDQARVLGYL